VASAVRRSIRARFKRALWQILLLLLAPPCLYLLVAHLFLLFPHAGDELALESESQVTQSVVDKHEAIEIYVIDNGIHVDLVLPRQHPIMDWNQAFGLTQKEFNYLTIGWGDQAFYLETPYWSDIRISTAMRALTGQNPALLHVGLLQLQDMSSVPPNRRDFSEAKAVSLSNAQYLALVNHIKSFMIEVTYTSTIRGYTEYDYFYPAKGHYSALQTCNTWAADGLQRAGLKVPRWAPFPWLVRAYERDWPKMQSP
jgi:uncharacterized protein (TIGR02117 family)